MVVDHIACTGFQVNDSSDDPEEQAELQMPLLWVCRNFRAIVYSHFCRSYELRLGSDMGVVESTRASWPSSLEQADYQTRHLAKDLQIEVDVWSIYSGKSSGLLSWLPGNDLVFPLVRSLSFYFVPQLRKKRKAATDIHSAEANISEFVKQVRRMAPLANNIKVETGSFSYDVHPSSCHHFTSLVSQLYRLDNRVVRSSLSCTVPFWEQHDLLNSVTYSGPQDYNANESILQLVRRNAPVLQALDMSLEASDIPGLVRDTSGDGYVCYPRLHKLNLTMLSSCTDTQRPKFTGATPFPVLQWLQISDEYPFGDDTPFRNNAATLEVLKINIDTEAVATFSRCNLFTTISHPKLQCVMTGLLPGLVQGCFGSGDACMRFILDMAPNASVREIVSIESDQGLSAALPLLHDYTRIQVLELPNTYVTLWDTIALAKSLPFLWDLRTMAPTLGTIPTGTTLLKLPMHVLSTYGTTNERFRCWNLNTTQSGIPKDTARCVLLLALICPSLDFVIPPISRHASFAFQLKKLLATSGFKQHKPRLQRLLTDRL
ncbi:hypothetical protein IWW37_001613 [Coemansia sp. RSA 2050]|nr:hypothetical protein IWW37_001613 [Coemansia sp. RSA 2050]KAJ2736906.1 hypothetical protein IW152_000417 [Coemansia sp. BCRC 34962]